jgi:hypothetical protein
MKLLDFVISEDIRFEVGNKVSLMGVLNDQIILTPQSPDGFKWPIATKAGFFAKFQFSKDDMIIDGIELKLLHNEKELGNLSVTAKLQDPNFPVLLPLIANPILLPGPGVMSFRFLMRKGSQVIKEIDTERTIKISVMSQK